MLPKLCPRFMSECVAEVPSVEATRVPSPPFRTGRGFSRLRAKLSTYDPAATRHLLNWTIPI